MKIKINLTLPEFSATRIVMWDYHMNDYAKGRYNIILGIDILAALGLNLKIPNMSSNEVTDL